MVSGGCSNNEQKKELSGHTILVVINCSHSYIVSTDFKAGWFMV